MEEKIITKNYEQIENDLNSKILKITMEIKDHYPELFRLK